MNSKIFLSFLAIFFCILCNSISGSESKKAKTGVDVVISELRNYFNNYIAEELDLSQSDESDSSSSDYSQEVKLKKTKRFYRAPTSGKKKHSIIRLG
jgi:hypothetical protein